MIDFHFYLHYQSLAHAFKLKIKKIDAYPGME